MIVATVLRSGGTYSPHWVWALKRGAGRHMSLPYEHLTERTGDGWSFAVLTDLSGLGTWALPLGPHDHRGWWSKLALFWPDVGLPDGALVLYMDLDTTVVGDLAPFAAYEGDLCLLSDFNVLARPQTGVILFRVGSPPVRQLWARWDALPPEEHMRRKRGDGEWVQANVPDHDRLQTLWPGAVVSFKKHARSGPPDGARIVCAHGKPKQDDPRTWMHAEWKQ